MYMYICMYRNQISKDIINQSRSSDYGSEVDRSNIKSIERLNNSE
jgi:hypothetical protein